MVNLMLFDAPNTYPPSSIHRHFEYFVWFGRLLLGWIDPATDSFLRAEDRPQEAVQP